MPIAAFRPHQSIVKNAAFGATWRFAEPQAQLYARTESSFAAASGQNPTLDTLPDRPPDGRNRPEAVSRAGRLKDVTLAVMLSAILVEKGAD